MDIAVYRMSGPSLLCVLVRQPTRLSLSCSQSAFPFNQLSSSFAHSGAMSSLYDAVRPLLPASSALAVLSVLGLTVAATAILNVANQLVRY
jgi:hypothetical protein